MAFVAAAGPLSNFAAAFVALVALRLVLRSESAFPFVAEPLGGVLFWVYLFNLGSRDLQPDPASAARRRALPPLPVPPRLVALHPPARAGGPLPADPAGDLGRHPLRGGARAEPDQRLLPLDRPPAGLVLAGRGCAPSWRQEPALPPQPAPVAGQRGVAADQAMTGHHEGDRDCARWPRRPPAPPRRRRARGPARHSSWCGPPGSGAARARRAAGTGCLRSRPGCGRPRRDRPPGTRGASRSRRRDCGRGAAASPGSARRAAGRGAPDRTRARRGGRRGPRWRCARAGSGSRR